MTTNELKIAEFSLLASLDQKEKLISILSEIQNVAPKFKETLEFIQSVEFPRSEYLIEVYENILGFAEELKLKYEEEIKIKSNNYNNSIKNIKIAESAEKDECNLDIMLKSI